MCDFGIIIRTALVWAKKEGVAAKRTQKNGSNHCNTNAKTTYNFCAHKSFEKHVSLAPVGALCIMSRCRSWLYSTPSPLLILLLCHAPVRRPTSDEDSGEKNDQKLMLKTVTNISLGACMHIRWRVASEPKIQLQSLNQHFSIYLLSHIHTGQFCKIGRLISIGSYWGGWICFLRPVSWFVKQLTIYCQSPMMKVSMSASEKMKKYSH